MAYRKKTSTEIEKARRRLAGIESISTTLDLGSGLTCVAYTAKIDALTKSLDAYNVALSQADAARTNFETLEKELGSLSERMLAGVGVKYGYDSVEYEKAGGTRKSEIKRPARAKARA